MSKKQMERNWDERRGERNKQFVAARERLTSAATPCESQAPGEEAAEGAQCPVEDHPTAPVSHIWNGEYCRS